jgi:hypothetical protein
MRELLVCSQEIKDQKEQPHCYHYSILIDEMDVGRFSCESYGVKISENPEGEVAAVSHVTTSIPRIDELMDLLTSNSVTPVGLRDVIEDWL